MGLAAGAPALADGFEPIKTAPPVTVAKGVEVEAAIGWMQGEANEFVYREDGSKLSQLVWAFDNDLVFKGGIAVRPLDWFVVGARFMTNISEGSALDDYDWIPESDPDGCPGGLCQSRSSNTKLQSFLSVDAYVAARFYQSQWMALSALAGYKRDSASWEAFGGWANYTTLPPGLGISYNQVWQAPYLGLQVNGAWQRWRLQGRIIGSWWAGGKDEDDHHLRTLLFTEHFGESNMIGANAHLGYRLTENLLLKAEYDLQQWQLAKGPSASVDYSTGERGFTDWNAAGGESITQTVLFGAALEY